MKFTDLRCNHLINPIGYKMTRPVFQFICLGKTKEPRILIAKDPGMKEIVYDSGIRTDMDPCGFEADFTPERRTRYFWQVRDGEEASEVAFFETGKMGEAWQAKFITCRHGEDERHIVFSKKIEISKTLETASLYITGVGLYEAFIGSKRVGDEYMTPYCNNYHSWLQVQTYDVTEMLDHSKTLSIAIGNGWYRGRFGFRKEQPKCLYGCERAALAELHLCYADGSEEVIGTDESWTVERSNLLDSSIYDGELWDDTLAKARRSRAVADLNAEAKLKSILSDRLSLPVRIMNRLKPVSLIITPKGEKVLDIGQNLTGIFELKVRVPEGTKVRLQFGEILQEGCFFRDNYRSAKAEFTYISDGKSKVIRPQFAFYGYRYVKVEGIEDLKKDDFTALVLHSDLEVIGTMQTGNKLIDQLLHNVIWGQKGNFLDVPTDCPQRDERLGWTGDAEVFCPTASYWMDTAAFYRKYLYDMHTEQAEHEGAVPHVIPSFGMEGSACAWADAATIIPWKNYVFTGDKKILEENFKGMTDWVDYVTRLEDEQDHQWEKQFHYGDWLALDHPDPQQIVLGGTSEGFLAECYYLYSTSLVIKAAKVLGHEDQAMKYQKLYDRILAYIRENYYTPTGRCAIDTMTAHIMTLVLGLSVDPDKSAKGLEKLLDYSHGKLKTGFIGTPFLCPTLSAIGDTDRAYDLLFNEEYPGWLYEVKNGATTIWERWNSVLEDGRLSDLTMNSLNHYAYGSIVEWIWRFSAGLDPVEEVPGFKEINYHPSFDERMGYMKAEYRSASGLWKSEWKIKNRKVTVKLTVPEGCRAKVSLPGAGSDVYAAMGIDPVTLTAEAGEYAVTYKI